MDVVATQYLLGIRPVAKGLVIDPCIPYDWKGFTVKRIFRGCELDVQVENASGVQKGVKELYFNGNLVDITNGAMLTPEILSTAVKAKVKVVMG